MKIDDMIKALYAMRDRVGGNAEVPFVTTFGESDYIIPEYPIIGDFEDQDRNEFKCAFIGSSGGEEFTQKGIPHYEWKPSKCKLDYAKEFRFDGYVHMGEKDLKKFPEPTIVDMSDQILKVKLKYAYPKDSIVNGYRDNEIDPLIPGYDKKDHESIKWNIDAENGVILNWTTGTTAKTNYKIVDQFEYDYDGFHYDGYVPDFMGIDDESFGDYVSISVDKNGKIKNWSKSKFFKEHDKLKSGEESDED